jgi:CheY-like chemotaxis protein
MDHMMPKMDGMEATQAIRKLGGEYERLPIIALTANAVSGMREMFLNNGFSDFISKPIRMQELNKVLKKWMPPEKILPEKTE